MLGLGRYLGLQATLIIDRPLGLKDYVRGPFLLEIEADRVVINAMNGCSMDSNKIPRWCFDLLGLKKHLVLIFHH